MNFESLISPISKESFLNDYFEKRPLVIQRNNPFYFDELLTLSDLDTILHRGNSLGKIEVSMSNSKRKIYSSEYLKTSLEQNVVIRNGLDLPKALNLFSNDKATLLVNFSQRVWKPINDLVKSIGDSLNSKAGANIFITPSYSQCFDAHFDEHDLFIVQISGSKKWKIFEYAEYLPLEPQNQRQYDFSKLKLLHEVELKAGDTVYFPRGFVHEVITTNEVSTHITFGCVNVTWLATIENYLKSVLKESAYFRSNLDLSIYQDKEKREVFINDLCEFVERELTLEKLATFTKKENVKKSTEEGFKFKMPELSKHLEL
ncbi:hypothetical protein SanaruYs_34860 [Chryseotalea sanaruensis]|uniref:JmjC domain-containing protein n=1 Tax=Chryseotalea sanaruensis TaxID=2482724 RepID=A0A401UEC7_9BACT|nr:cupin domain-containing protein [Chryseotalea sanaruensis]GCC53243.1 hypothetical protein SanaruYs_34860 [Chryseotalea sanaruensis]